MAFLPTFFFPLKPNAGGEPPPTAGAQRTLLAVGSSAWFGAGLARALRITHQRLAEG